jgi:3-hydroxyisobutyrate dehydrogenase-like beta-hydroxyacid dehydrogenase
MAGHVLAAGHELTVWNRTPGKASTLTAGGAHEAASPGEAAREADALVLVLFGPPQVEELLFGPDGAVSVMKAGSVVVDTTTIAPSDARRFATSAAEHGIRYVDAPLFGSVQPARDGTLSTFVGASEDDFAQIRPLLECWCEPANVHRAGDVGAGAAVKIVRNMGHGIATAAIGECLRLADELGIDRDLAMSTVAVGPFSWTFQQKAAAVAHRDYSDVAFALDLMTKDLALAVGEARTPLTVAEAALTQARGAVDDGLGRADYIALADWVEHQGR